MMSRMPNSIHRRITEVHVGRSHVDFGSQRLLAVFELTFFHSLKQIEILVD
jgi:hypothetical protein